MPSNAARAARYREHAVELLSLATTTAHAATRAELERLALEYQLLAELLEKWRDSEAN